MARIHQANLVSRRKKQDILSLGSALAEIDDFRRKLP